jgi:hypothetical protein
MPGARATTGPKRLQSSIQIVHLTRVDSWAGADVLEARVVDGLGEEGVALLVRARERNTSRVRATSTSNLDLEASDVWLGLTNTGVQRKNLSTDEVVAGSDALGDGERALSAVGVEDLSSPGGDGAGVAIFCDLEERAAGGGFGIRHLGHVNENGAVVVATDGRRAACAVTRLGVHLNGEGTAGYGIC